MLHGSAIAFSWRQSGSFLFAFGGVLCVAALGCEADQARPAVGKVAHAQHAEAVPTASDLKRAPQLDVSEGEPFHAPAPVTTVSDEAAAYGQGLFLGEPEGERRRSLALSPIAEVERGGGGRSVGFKITLEDGTSGYYKPEQSFSAAHWYSEVAAYYLDRTLGFGRVAPVIGRRFAWKALRPAAGNDPRVSEVTVGEDGTVRGAFVWWVPEGLNGLPLGIGWEKWIRVDGEMDISPFQRVSSYLKARSASEEELVAAREKMPPRKHADEPDKPDRPAELSDMIIFDYLISNLDRWGGSFVNVRTRGFLGPLLFFDNGAGFWPGQQRFTVLDRRLASLQRFRRSTIDALKSFDMDDFRRRLAQDPLDPVLGEPQIEGVAARRALVLEHIAKMQKRFGEQAVPW